MTGDWLTAALALRRDGRPGVLVTLAQVRGHAPRDAGAKMVVTTQDAHGSVGGGNLEASAVSRARAMLGEGARVPELLDLELSEHAPARHGVQCCGGRVRVLLEPLTARPVVAVFGAGHVGHELARILSRLDLVLHLVDSRAELLSDDRLGVLAGGTAEVVARPAVAPESVLAGLPAGAHVVVMTHDHAEDLAVCDQALRRPDLGRVGLIGSVAKWARFRRTLEGAGHDPAAVAAISCPIGIPDAGAKEPAAIAVAVAAEVLSWLRVDAGPALPAGG
mgnify:CR=1 FL=1